MFRKLLIATGIVILTSAVSITSVWAATHEVLMLNKDPDNKKLRNVFSPAVLKIEVGDTVKFISTDKGHNTQSYKKGIPEGAEKWKSKIGKEFEITFTTEGTYQYKCTPHASMGMIGLILVGDYTGNYDDVQKNKKVKGKAKKAFKELYKQVDTME
ncbi:MAG: pseudoazurin [OCS116 cluster bacterium]|nr:pseudoazurin [OCS116 cluster bacterium]